MELKGLTGSDMNKLTVATMQVDALRKQVTDAQATIAALQDTIMQMGGQAAVLAKDAMAAKEQVAALQARVSELQGIADEKCRCFLERAEQSEKQLTQRTAELEAAKAELEQERVRLASCLIAAEGGTKDIVKQGDYGWSPAYQATLNLQAELERVTGERDQLLTCQCEGCDESLEGSAYCERCFAKLRALILALPKVEGA